MADRVADRGGVTDRGGVAGRGGVVDCVEEERPWWRRK